MRRDKNLTASLRIVAKLFRQFSQQIREELILRFFDG